MLTHLHNVHQQAGEHHHGRIDSMQQPSEEVESAMEEAALETSSIADPTSSGLSSMPCDNSASSSCIGTECILDFVIHSVKLVIRPQSSNMEHKWQVQPHVQLTLYFSAARLLSDHNVLKSV